jgi:hypothetical protein
MASLKRPNGPAGARSVRRGGPAWVARAVDHLGGQHLAIVVDGDIMVSSPYSFLPAAVGKLVGALVLDRGAGVVIHRIHGLARGRADVALLGPGVLLVDAALDLGQQLDQLAAFFLARDLLGRGAGLRCGSGGGKAASCLRTWASSIICCSCSVCVLARACSSACRPSVKWTAATAWWPGPCRGRPRRPCWPAPWPAPCRVCRWCGRIDQDDLERRVLEHPVETLRVDETHGQQGRMHGQRGAQRQLHGAESAQLHEPGLSPPGGEHRPRFGHIDRNRDRAGHDLFVVVLASSSAPAALRRHHVQPLDHRAGHVQRDRRRLAQRTRTRAPRGRSCAPITGNTSGSVSARTRYPSLNTVATSSVMPFCSRYLQRPEALHRALVAVVGAVGGVESRR